MSLNSGLHEVFKIFQQNIFRVPDYQRGYSWQTKQLNEFWEDLLNIQNKRHYTGVLTLERIPKEIYINNTKWERDRWLLEGDRNYEPFYIVDGQQRITTIIILLSLILDSVKGDKIDLKRKDEISNQYIAISCEEGKSYIFGYEVDDPSDKFLRAYVLGEDEISNNLSESLYTRNIANAKKFFQRKINELRYNKNDNELVKIYKKITNYLVFNVYVIDNEIDVSVAFETMNNRGITLSKLELLKNRLMYLTTVLENGEESELRNDINDCWREVYKYLGKRVNLKDDVFLKDHWIMYFGNYNKNEQDAFATFLLEKYFILRNISKGDNSSEKIGIEKIRNYVKSVEKNIFYWFTIFYPEYRYSKFSKDIKEWLLRLKDLGRGAFTPLIMAALSVESDDNKLLALLKSMERYVFLVFKISQRRADAGNSKFYHYAYELLNNKVNIENIISSINQTVYTKSGLYYYGFYDIDRFKNYIKDCYINPIDGKMGYLGWSKLKYLLCEYEIYIRRENNINTHTDIQTLDKITEVSLISDYYSEKWKIPNGLSLQQRNYVKYSLGNTFLKHVNFYDKINNSDEIKIYSQLELEDSTEWTPSLILQRGMKILKFFEKRWDVQIKNEDFIKEILFLDFIEN